MWGFEAWHLWIALGLALAVAELLGAEFVLLALGIACLGGAAAAMAGAALATQILTTGVLAAVLVPFAITRLRHAVRPGSRYGVTGSGAERGTVVEVIEQAGDVGLKFRGDFLPARLPDGDSPEPGTRVRIREVRGITAIVDPAEPDD